MAKKKKTSAPSIAVEVREKRREKEQSYLFWLSRFYVVFVLAVYPLYVGMEGYNDIVHSKAVLYWSVTITLLLLFLVFFIVHVSGENRAVQSAPWYKRLNVTDYALLAYLFVITLSCVFSPYKGGLFLGDLNRYDGYLSAALMIAGFFMISRWYRPKEPDMTIYAASSMILCVIGYLQFYGWDIFGLFPYTQWNQIDANGNPLFSGYSISYRTTIGNINFVGIYTCIAIVVFTVLYIRTKTPVRFVYLSASVMNFVMMIISHSRAGTVGVLGMLVLAAPFWISEKEGLGRLFVTVSAWGFSYALHHWIVVNRVFPTFTDSRPAYDLAMKASYNYIPLKLVVLLSAVSLAVGLILIFIKFKKWFGPKAARIAGAAIIIFGLAGGLAGIEIIGQRMPAGNLAYEARELLHGNLSDNLGSYRMFIWKRAIEKLPEQPLIGTGPDTFYKAFGKENQDVGIEFHGVTYDKAHNDFIQIAFCYGIVGLIIYLVFIISLLVKSVRPAYGSVFALLSLCGALAYLAQSFFGIDTVIVTPVFWLIMGILRGEQLRCETAGRNGAAAG